MRSKTFNLTIGGTGRFPLDMLRYACAWPLSTIDATNIEQSHDSSLSPRGHREITITMLPCTWGHADNVRMRFESFGWKGTPEEMA